jgi:hypothetical protein
MCLISRGNFSCSALGTVAARSPRGGSFVQANGLPILKN